MIFWQMSGQTRQFMSQGRSQESGRFTLPWLTIWFSGVHASFISSRVFSSTERIEILQPFCGWNLMKTIMILTWQGLTDRVWFFGGRASFISSRCSLQPRVLRFLNHSVGGTWRKRPFCQSDRDRRTESDFPEVARVSPPTILQMKPCSNGQLSNVAGIHDRVLTLER